MIQGYIHKYQIQRQGMLRNFSKNSTSKSSTVFSRLRSSLQISNPSSDRLNDTQTKQLAQTLKSSITKSRSQRKIKNTIYNKQNYDQTRSSSVKMFTPNATSPSVNLSNVFKKNKVVFNDSKQHQPQKQHTKTHKTNKTRLNEEYKECVQRLDHSKHIHIGDNECFLDYKTFIQIMTEMNYLNFWKEDNLLLNEMWKDLGGQEYGGFLKSSLLLFLEMMEGMLQHCKGSSDGGARHQKIYNKYQRFRSNRSSANSKTQGTTEKGQSVTKVKDRGLQLQDQNTKEVLSLKHSIRIRDEQPKANRNQVRLRKKSDIVKRNERLGDRANEKVFRVCFELDQIIALKEQNTNNKENISHLQQPQTKPNTSHEESVDSTPEIVQTKPKNIRVPLLSLDINLGQGKTDKIIIYEGDTSKFIAEQLAIKHSLDRTTCDKFQKILDNHLKHLLSKIEQVEELTQDLSCSHRQI